MRLLDAREQEHAVVGREPERDREQQDGCVDSTRLGSCSRAEDSNRPSWKISTSRPNAALSVSRFMISALTGSTTEPVIRNRISVVKQRSERERQIARRSDDWSRRSAAVCPPLRRRTARELRAPPAPRPARSRRDRALGDARRSATARPADRRPAPRRRRRRSAPATRIVLDRIALASRTATNTAPLGTGGKSRLRASSTSARWRLGSTLASTPVNSTRRNGIPMAISSTDVAIATGVARRMTQSESRYQTPSRGPRVGPPALQARRARSPASRARPAARAAR